jgi:signal peptidase II
MVRRRVTLTAAAVVGVDQATKALAPLTRSGAVLPLRNRELLLGVVGGNRVALALLMVAVLVGFGRHVVRRVQTGTLSPVAAGLLVGGAFANLTDRAVLGSVRDFIVIGHVMVVNVADLAVAVGLVLYARAHYGARPVTGLATACDACD